MSSSFAFIVPKALGVKNPFGAHGVGELDVLQVVLWVKLTTDSQ
jgi:hypothetical protein